MQIAITGATGLIGQKLVSELLNLGHDIHVLSRNPDLHRKNFSEKVHLHAWNYSQNKFPEDLLAQVESVIHLAGENIASRPWTASRKKALYDSRIESTKALVQILNQKAACLKSFVSTSAVGFYADAQDRPLAEDSPLGEGFLANLCSDWEKMALNLKVKASIVRVGVVLSQEGGALAKMLLPFKLGLGGRLGDGKQWMSWVHIDDLVNLYIQLSLKHLTAGIYNGTAPNPVTNLKFTKTLGQTLKRPTLFPVPKFILKTLLGEMSDILLHSQKAVPTQALKQGFKFKYPDLELALKNLC